VLGPGHRWPALLLPLYALFERLPATRDATRRLGLVTLEQMVSALAYAVEHPPERLRDVELKPFQAAIAAGVASIMTAHVLVPALDDERPATLSRRIVTGLLREELGFPGIIFSDDLEMKALASEHTVPSVAVLAVEAGCDGLLICSGNHDVQAQSLEALIHAVEEERLPLARVEDAFKRQQRAKERFLAVPVAADRPPSAKALRQALGTAEHHVIADQMARFA